MGKVLIGTSGFSYKDWIGPFYPNGTSQHNFLNLYSKEFVCTELNFTYYRQPEANLLNRMAEITPDLFLFSVKAYQSFTHKITPGTFQADCTVFKKGIEPLSLSGKLGAILFQFPYSFSYNSVNRTYLDTLCNHFSEFPLAIEFRNSAWVKDSVFKELQSRQIASVNVDEPDLPNLVKPLSKVTSRLAYIRFHGRNAANWWNGDNVTRYDYLYSPQELLEWVPRIDEMSRDADTVMVFFNNHAGAQAVKNAKELQGLLEKSP